MVTTGGRGLALRPRETTTAGEVQLSKNGGTAKTAKPPPQIPDLFAEASEDEDALLGGLGLIAHCVAAEPHGSG